jgi:CubicO group peptidase (beta-lactamase class C family)
MPQKTPATATITTRLQKLEDHLHALLEAWKLPGLALLVMQDDEMVLARGFGKRHLAQGLPMTARTLLPIGSCSKAFTAAAIAMLVEEGRLEWDKPVRDYLPGFRMQDQFASERMTARDLLAHRSGLPGHDLMWYKSRITRKELVERLRYLEPNTDFRTTYHYQNMMYAAAGYLIECVTGNTWEEFITRRLLEPLGMTSSTLSVVQSQQSDDYALPYEKEDDEVKEVPFYEQWQHIAPAGGINSNLEDIAHWLRFQLHQGKHGETQLLAAAQLAQTHTPQTIIPPSPLFNFPEVSTSSYGMGWGIGTFRGHRMLHHTGGIDGFSAEVVLLPDDAGAVAVFTNVGQAIAHHAAAFYACDHLLGAEETDWSGRWQAAFAQANALGEQQVAALTHIERVPNAPPSHALDAYSGVYEHPGYGTVTITCEDARRYWTHNEVRAPLTHIHYDVFELFLKLWMHKTSVSFATGDDGSIERLAARLELAAKPIVFTRVAHKSKPAV